MELRKVNALGRVSPPAPAENTSRAPAPEVPWGPSPASGSAPSTPTRGAPLATWVGRAGRTIGFGALAVLAACGSINEGPTRGGPLGPTQSEVRREIQQVPVRIAPTHYSAQQKLDHYRAIFQAAGGRWRPGRTHVLALRGIDWTNGRVHATTANPRMSDTIVVLRDTPGDPGVFEFLGSTHPGQNSIEAGRIGRDVDRDGNRDVGMVSEGAFRATSNGDFLGEPSFHITRFSGADGLPGVRDTNQDGIHSPEEWAGSVRRGDRLHEVLFHVGVGQRVNSVGCWNVADYDAFVAAVGGEHASFEVALVNAYGAEPR